MLALLQPYQYHRFEHREEGEETRKAVEVMLSLIAETSTYILSQTSDGIIGTLELLG